MTRSQKLYRSIDDKRIAGVAGGLAEFFSLDATIVRLLFAGLMIAGPGLVLYVLLWVLVPREPSEFDEHIGFGWFLLRAVGLVAGITMLGALIDDLALTAFVIGLFVGLLYLWRNLRSDEPVIAPEVASEYSFDASDGFDDEPLLYRSTADRRLLGVFGGLAERLGVNSTYVRMAGMAFFVVAFPVSIGAYLLYALAVPERSPGIRIR